MEEGHTTMIVVVHVDGIFACSRAEEEVGVKSLAVIFQWDYPRAEPWRVGVW